MHEWRLNPYSIQWLYKTPMEKRCIIKQLPKEMVDTLKMFKKEFNAMVLELEIQNERT